MGTTLRRSEIHRRRVRHRKIKMLRARYAAARNDAEREQILTKLGRVAPTLSRERFLATVAEKADR